MLKHFKFPTLSVASFGAKARLLHTTHTLLCVHTTLKCVKLVGHVQISVLYDPMVAQHWAIVGKPGYLLGVFGLTCVLAYKKRSSIGPTTVVMGRHCHYYPVYPRHWPGIGMFTGMCHNICSHKALF